MPPFVPLDESMMRKALHLARRAGERGDVPVGAIVARGSEIVGYGYNARESTGLPTRHAEIDAMEMAARAVGAWRLDGCTLYVTKEPCVMCAGAIVLARLERVVYGALDPKGGCCGSLYDLPTDPRFNHRCAVASGLLADECAALLTAFFQARREARVKSGPDADSAKRRT